DLIPSLGGSDPLAPVDPKALGEVAVGSLTWRSDSNDRRDGLRHLVRRQDLCIAGRDVLGLTDGVEATGTALTALAETTLAVALELLAPTVPFAVIAMGRFGRADLSYAIDLDVLFVHEGRTCKRFGAAEA